MVARQLLFMVTLIVAFSSRGLAQECNNTAGFITNIADFPTSDLIIVNFTDYPSWLGSSGPITLNATDEISVELSNDQAFFFSGTWAIDLNGLITDLVFVMNSEGNFSYHFAKPVTYFATRINYSPASFGDTGYPIIRVFNEANEAVACYNLETMDPIRTVNALVFKGVYYAPGISKISFEGSYICSADIIAQLYAPPTPPLEPPVEAPVDSPVTSPVMAPSSVPATVPVVAAPVAGSPKSPVAKTSSATSVTISALILAAILCY